MKACHLLLTTVFLLATPWLPPTAAAQETPTAEAGSEDLDGVFFGVSNTNIVNIDVFVTDKKGNPITGLTKEDFIVFEEGRQVDVTNFYAVNDGRPVRPTATASATEPLDAEGGIERPDLRLEEIELSEDERLHLIIYIDNKNLRPASRNRVLNRMHRFLRSELSRNDRVMVVSYDQSITVRQPFTSDMDLVEDALDEISGTSGSATLRDSERRSTMEDIDDAEDLFSAMQYARSYADSVYTEMEFSFKGLEKQISVLSGLTGRKSILHVSDGLPRTVAEDVFIFVDEKFRRSNARLEAAAYDYTDRYRQIVTSANSSDVTFYTLEATGLGAHQSLTADFGGSVEGGSLAFVDTIRAANLQEPLHLLAEDTGGESFTNTNAVEMSLGKVARDFKNYYSLGYEASHFADGRYYKIEVKTRRKDLKIRHRAGYRDRTSQNQLADGSVATLHFGSERNPFDAEINFGKPTASGRHYIMPMSIKIPLNQLALAPQNDLYVGRVRISFVVMDESGGTSEVQQQEPLTIRIPVADIEKAREQHFLYDIGLTLRKGYSRIAVGIRDELSSEIAFLRKTVDLGS